MKKIICFFLVATTMAYAANYKDGKYTAQSFSPYKGWTSVVEVTIKNGEIADINIEDYNKAKEKRSENQKENAKLKKASKYDYNELVANFKSKILQKESPDKIDSVAGATTIIKKFKGLTAVALKNAEKGDTKRAYD